MVLMEKESTSQVVIETIDINQENLISGSAYQEPIPVKPLTVFEVIEQVQYIAEEEELEPIPITVPMTVFTAIEQVEIIAEEQGIEVIYPIRTVPEAIAFIENLSPTEKIKLYIGGFFNTLKMWAWILIPISVIVGIFILYHFIKSYAVEKGRKRA